MVSCSSTEKVTKVYKKRSEKSNTRTDVTTTKRRGQGFATETRAAQRPLVFDVHTLLSIVVSFLGFVLMPQQHSGLNKKVQFCFPDFNVRKCKHEEESGLRL